MNLEKKNKYYLFNFIDAGFPFGKKIYRDHDDPEKKNNEMICLAKLF